MKTKRIEKKGRKRIKNTKKKGQGKRAKKKDKRGKGENWKIIAQ